MVTRYVGSGREKEGGFLAVHKQDFEAHRTGGDWRHKADHIDMNPPLAGFPQPDVQKTLEAIAGFLSGGASSYLSIGDGYARGDYNVGDPTTPTLESAFTAALASPRLANGGTILLKPGKFTSTSTITLPPGISVIGDMAGVYINRPSGDSPIFKVQRSLKFFNQGTYPGTIGDPQTNANLISYQTDVNTFYNLILTDNLGPPTPTVPALANSPMIQCERGSNVVVERVTFLGRTRNAAPFGATWRGIAYTGTSPSRPTSLHVKDCVFDVVQSAIQFDPQEGAADTLRVESCRARTVGDVPGTVEDFAFVSFNICNATLINNYHVGLGGIAGYGASRCFQIRNFSPSNGDVRVVIMGNSGGIYQTTTDVESQFLVDGRATKTAFEGVITGNSWGNRIDNDWYLTIGDGFTSVGDITGVDSLDVAVVRARSTYETATIVLNHGTYSLTQTGTSSQRVRLVGNSKSGKPTISVAGTGTVGAMSHNGIYVGDRLINLKFNASGARQTLFMYPETSSVDAHWLVQDCEFDNVTVNIQRTYDTTYDAANIVNCEFYQTGAYPDTVSLVLTEAIRFINIESCYFHQYGYAIYIGDLGGTFDAEQRINIERCRFNGVVDKTLKAISGVSTLGQNNYIYISNGSKKSDVTIRDTTIAFTDDTDYNKTLLPVNDVLVAKFLSITCGTLTVDNSKIFGPYQSYSSGQYAMPTLFIDAKRGIQLLNSRIFGALPVKINGGSGSCLDNSQNVRSQFGDGAWLRIDGCELSTYEQISIYDTGSIHDVMPTVLDIELEKYVGSDRNSTGMVNITNSSFFTSNDSRSGPIIPAQHYVYTGTYYKEIGCVQIYAEGWGIHFTNNDLNATFPLYASGTWNGHSALAVDLVGQDSADMSGACALINSNRINVRTDWNTLNINHMCCIHVAANFPTITGNHFRFSSNTISGNKLFVRTQVGGGIEGGIISGNVFQVSEPISSSFNRFDFTGGKGKVTGNTFWSPGAVTSVTPTNYWIISSNRNQDSSTRIRPYDGLFTAKAGSYGGAIYGTDTGVYPGTYNLYKNVKHILVGASDGISLGSPTTMYSFRLMPLVNQPTSDTLTWIIPLVDYLPHDAVIYSLVFQGLVGDAADWDALSIQMVLAKSTGGFDTAVGSDTRVLADGVLTGPQIQTSTIGIGPELPVWERPIVTIIITYKPDFGTSPIACFSSLQVNYRW